MNRTERKYDCSLVNKEVRVSEGTVITGNGAVISQRGCCNELKCQYVQDKRCFANKPI